jgi:hypothetical protein
LPGLLKRWEHLMLRSLRYDEMIVEEKGFVD